jgi:hypothetical protein
MHYSILPPPIPSQIAMAKFIIFLLTLALVAASSNSKHGGASASADYDDLPQRQEAMAEAVRAMSSYESTTRRSRATRRSSARWGW